MRIARLLLVIVLAAITSGAPTVVRAAFDSECCEQGCNDSSERKPCAPDCTGPCANAHTPLTAGAPQCFRREPTARSVVNNGADAPVLPLVVNGVFHPPRS
jgi:hypothetical protein